MEASACILWCLVGALLALNGASCGSIWKEPLVRVGIWKFPLTQVMQLSTIIEEEGLDDNSLSILCYHEKLPKCFHRLCYNSPLIANSVFAQIRVLTSDPYFEIYCFLCQSSACQPCYPSRQARGAL